MTYLKTVYFQIDKKINGIKFKFLFYTSLKKAILFLILIFLMALISMVFLFHKMMN